MKKWFWRHNGNILSFSPLSFDGNEKYSQQDMIKMVRRLSREVENHFFDLLENGIKDENGKIKSLTDEQHLFVRLIRDYDAQLSREGTMINVGELIPDSLRALLECNSIERYDSDDNADMTGWKILRKIKEGDHYVGWKASMGFDLSFEETISDHIGGIIKASKYYAFDDNRRYLFDEDGTFYDRNLNPISDVEHPHLHFTIFKYWLPRINRNWFEFFDNRSTRNEEKILLQNLEKYADKKFYEGNGFIPVSGPFTIREALKDRLEHFQKKKCNLLRLMLHIPHGKYFIAGKKYFDGSREIEFDNLGTHLKAYSLFLKSYKSKEEQLLDFMNLDGQDYVCFDRELLKKYSKRFKELLK